MVYLPALISIDKYTIHAYHGSNMVKYAVLSIFETLVCTRKSGTSIELTLSSIIMERENGPLEDECLSPQWTPQWSFFTSMIVGR